MCLEDQRINSAHSQTHNSSSIHHEASSESKALSSVTVHFGSSRTTTPSKQFMTPDVQVLMILTHYVKGNIALIEWDFTKKKKNGTQASLESTTG